MKLKEISMEITIFTPTYNRAYTILKLYESLKKQTFRDFEWIVIDDGSIDSTEEIFLDILTQKNDFPIIYRKVDNGGKHRAINKGIQLASGRLFFIVDSDDFLPYDSLARVSACEKSLTDNKTDIFAGVAGIKGKIGGGFCGKTFDGEYLDITYLETGKNGIYGDKAEVYYTDVLRQYPFPEFDGEKFIMESVVWNVIAEAGYKLRYFNEIVYLCEYLEDGLTNQGTTKFINTPKGYGLYLSQLIKYGKLKKIKKWQTIFEYYKLFHERFTIFDMARNLKMNPICLWLRILGIRLFYKIYNR